MHTELHRDDIKRGGQPPRIQDGGERDCVTIAGGKGSFEAGAFQSAMALSSLVYRDTCNIESDIFFDPGFGPFVEIAALATAHVEDLSAIYGPISTTGWRGLRIGTCCEYCMPKVCKEDGFDPVVEVLETDDGRILTHLYAYFWSSVVWR